MTPLLLAILLFAVGLVLLAAEFFIPAHGVTAGLGLLAFVTGVIACFFAGEWIGVGVLGVGAILGPVAAVGWMRVFPYTWLARRIALPTAPRGPSPAAAAPAPVRVGQTGVSISALRPSGVCEFADLRLDIGTGQPTRIQVISDFGDIAPGRRVRVICFSDGRVTVRECST